MMGYLKKLFNSFKSAFLYVILSYGVIFVSFIFYYLFGNVDVKNFLVSYASYVLVIFNLIYVYVLFKKYDIKLEKCNNLLVYVMLGISISCIFNMLTIGFKSNDVVSVNVCLLIFSSVIVGPLVEEVVFRYIVTNRVLKFNNKFFTVLISSLFFALMHNGLINFIYAFILGIVLNVIYLRDKKLINLIIIHSSANMISIFLSGYNGYILVISVLMLLECIFILNRKYL